ncbi:MAG TPA: polymer-forming cytoskeletal protein [Terriglobales bacterium]
MSDKPDDLGIPIRPARPPGPTVVPARVTNPPPPKADAPNALQDTAAEVPVLQPNQPRTMVVGQGISLSGDIRSCSRLVVEGSLEATLHDCNQMEIAQGGYFKGKASIERAEISGEFEGELVVSRRLLIRSSGHVSGTVTYGEIEIERGGRITGTIQSGPGGASLPASLALRAGE